jgi:four helix bundle protein
LKETKYSLDNFELYKLARQFRRNVYKLIKQLPKEEQYCLDPQMREAIISVTNNIAEGHGRWYYQENMRFCRISRGSVEEILVAYFLNTCRVVVRLIKRFFAGAQNDSVITILSF